MLLIVALPQLAAAADNNGKLTVDNNTTECPGAGGEFGYVFPDFSVIQGSIVHINISPAFAICTSGDPQKIDNRCDDKAAGYCDQNFNCSNNFGTCRSTCVNGPTPGAFCTNTAQCGSGGTCTGASKCDGGGNSGAACSSNATCQVKTCNGGPNNGTICTLASQCTLAGSCQSQLESDCTADVEDVFVNGHHGTCETNADCDVNETCDTQTCNGGSCSISHLSCTVDADCPGVCSFQDQLTDSTRVGKGDIDVCYNVREDWCGDASVQYCVQPPPFNNKAVVQNPQSQVYVPGRLVSVDSEGEPAACAQALSTCLNEVGSICCGLTQGAYGSPNSVATSLGSTPNDVCNGTDLGFLVAAGCGGCDPFDSDPNDTTVGVHPTRSVTMGPGTDFLDALNSLISYLPSGGTSKVLNNVGDKHYPPNTSSGNSKGDGGGTLTGQAMATSLNVFLSDTCNPAWGGVPFDSGYTPQGFNSFELPAQGVLVCTKRSGPNKVLGDGDDVCEAFSYPDCTAGKTVADVLAAANQLLGNTANALSCSATDLNNALTNINVQFDQCGEVIDCGSVTTPGQFVCP